MPAWESEGLAAASVRVRGPLDPDDEFGRERTPFRDVSLWLCAASSAPYIGRDLASVRVHVCV